MNRWLLQFFSSLVPATLLLLLVCCPAARCGTPADERPGRGLKVIAIGDASESGSIQRGNASYISSMYTGQHDGGPFDLLLFLGDNFGPTGLNLPAAEVDHEIASYLGPFQTPIDGLGKSRVHAIPGEHDYYARNSVESSFLFGLIKTQEGPMGVSDKGNARARAISSWTYHDHVPDRAMFPLAPGAPDSAAFIFFDSGLLLRTPPGSWHAALEGLREILATEKARTHVTWHVLCTHHPLYSVGEHAGYSVWNEEDSTVGYLTACDKDSNASGWIRNLLDPEDLCTERYKQYVDSVTSIIRESGVNVQAVISSHENSLQLLDIFRESDERTASPGVQIISGAGSTTARVRAPDPPREFTAMVPKEEGESAPGFVQLLFTADSLRIVFYNERTGNPMDMGEGRTEFWVGKDGRMKNGE